MSGLHPAAENLRRVRDEQVAAAVAARDDALVAELDKGRTYREVAEEFGITHQAVGLIAAAKRAEKAGA